MERVCILVFFWWFLFFSVCLFRAHHFTYKLWLLSRIFSNKYFLWQYVMPTGKKVTVFLVEKTFVFSCLRLHVCVCMCVNRSAKYAICCCCFWRKVCLFKRLRSGARYSRKNGETKKKIIHKIIFQKTNKTLASRGFLFLSSLRRCGYSLFNDGSFRWRRRLLGGKAADMRTRFDEIAFSLL